MERNFSVGQGNELVLGDRTFDLHNCYDFGGVVIRCGGRVRLWFEPSVDQGSEGRPLVLDIEGVDRLELSAGVTLGAVCDLDEIGFKNPDDDDLDWLVSESHATSSDHLVFSFGPKEHIRVHGKLCQMREYHRPMHSLPGGPMAS